MTYFIAIVAEIYDRVFHAQQHIHDPFAMDYDRVALTSVSPEAQAAGLAKGDVVESLDGQRYTGEAQWRAIDHSARAGETLEVGVRDSKGLHHTVNLRLTPAEALHLSAGNWFILLALQFFCTLLCLLTGYWVVLAKPREPNAWLILLLLTVPEVIFTTPNWWSGGLQVFVELWYQTLQVAGAVVVFLIGIYFPERWRVDRRLPWLKWALIIPQLVALILVLMAKYGEYYHPSLGNLILAATPWVDRIVNPIALLCVILYWVAILDKLRSASTADARRRDDMTLVVFKVEK